MDPSPCFKENPAGLKAPDVHGLGKVEGVQRINMGGFPKIRATFKGDYRGYIGIYRVYTLRQCVVSLRQT